MFLTWREYILELSKHNSDKQSRRSFSKPLIFVFQVMRKISKQIRQQDPLMIAFASCENIIWISFKRKAGE